jgi:hypothetical protein
MRAAMELQRAVLEAAASPLDDEQAKDQLARELPDSQFVIERMFARCRAQRDEFLWERAERLLSAAWQGHAVQGSAPEVRELLSRQEQLGRLPIAAAYAQIVSLVPELEQVSLEVTDAISARPDERVPWALERKIWLLVGSEASHPDPLIRSTEAGLIVLIHLGLIYRYAKQELPGASYFDLAPLPTSRTTGTLAAWGTVPTGTP